MNAKALFLATLDQATAVIDHVAPDDYHRPTPDTEWDVAALAGHMLYELCWVPDLLQGKTIAEVGSVYDGDLIGDALAANWHAAAARAREALDTADLQAMVHVSYGDITAEAYLQQVAADLCIHAWDLGEGIGKSVAFPAQVTQVVYDYLLPRLTDYEQSNLFAPPVIVPEAADLQTKLLALTGRRVNWPAL
ncbi:MAG TPA: TIGR03086 family metal-binding protein [Candidatus Saccharimonadales bacterium]|nr:TIGR03086 family metal-binding protein [Candidatus Saccharimonadales bacterium]